MNAYDGSLQMFTTEHATINLARLSFLAWLFDNNRYQDDAPTNIDHVATFHVERRKWIAEKELV